MCILYDEKNYKKKSQHKKEDKLRKKSLKIITYEKSLLFIKRITKEKKFSKKSHTLNLICSI